MDAEAWFQKGNDHVGRREWVEAVACYERALALRPNHPETINNLGVALVESGKPADAIARYDAAIAAAPAYATAHYNRANALRVLQRPADALAAYEAALRCDGRFAPAWANRGLALMDLGRAIEAVGSYRQALALDARPAGTWNNLGLAMQALGRVEEAGECFEESLRLDPNFAGARCNRAQVWLLLGQWDRGWPEYESRLQLPRGRIKALEAPRWAGESLAGRTIVLRAEQGIGDAIMGVRYAAPLKARGATVVLDCAPRLHRLLATCPGVDRFVDGPLPTGALQVPLLSLPLAFGTTPPTIPWTGPYLRAESERVERWRRELPHAGAFRIGIGWQGSRGYPGDVFRSFPADHFAALANRPGVRLVSLQQNVPPTPLATDLGPALDADAAFVDTAAVIMLMDLVVTSDTALAHLAGALGVPVWVALSAAVDWRWLRDREDCPWYPTMRLFRQRRPGDWAEVFDRIARAISIPEHVPREGRS